MRTEVKNNTDLKFILDNLRDEDVNELKADHGENWKQETFENISKADGYICYSKENKPVLVYGVTRQNDIGIIWMLSTQEITEQVSFIRLAKEFVASCSNDYRVLCNFVHDQNKLALKWLKSLGFKFDVQDHTKENFLFFYKENLNV